MGKFIPTREQQSILQHDPQHHARVLAGPGTGKSATLVAFLDQLLVKESGLRMKFLTFTRAATSELAKKFSEHPVAATERPSTIHSFAISVLLKNPGAGDLPQPLRIADDWEHDEILRTSLAKRAGVSVKMLGKLLIELAANWESLRPEEDPRVSSKDRSRFLGAWNEHRQVMGYTLLSELPYALLHALKNYSDLQGVDYDLIVVDEYQDLNACDLEVLSLLATRGCAIIGAGDDDQSIYHFRKAAPEGIRRFLDDYPAAHDYSLSVTQRCGSNIIEWANHVITGDPDRPATRATLIPAPGSPPGECRLLSFANESEEAEGVAALIHKLLHEEKVPPEEILVLLRGDFNEAFSKPLKEILRRMSIPFSDPEAVKRMLEEPPNRQLIELFRLLVHGEDSLAWAGLLRLSDGIGDAFFEYIYERARQKRKPFGNALLEGYADGFPGGPSGSSQRAITLVKRVLEWMDAHQGQKETQEGQWGKWILELAQGEITAVPTKDFQELLLALDELGEEPEGLERYLGQIAPLGKDRAQAESKAVRIMTMSGAKGLTVQATIVMALEDGIVPRPDCELGEERRLLYVAMTRARKCLFATWARRRKGPTARAGKSRVGLYRKFSHFLDGGPVKSQDGLLYLRSE